MSYINLRFTYLLTNRYRITDVRLLKLSRDRFGWFVYACDVCVCLQQLAD